MEKMKILLPKVLLQRDLYSLVQVSCQAFVEVSWYGNKVISPQYCVLHWYCCILMSCHILYKTKSAVHWIEVTVHLLQLMTSLMSVLACSWNPDYRYSFAMVCITITFVVYIFQSDGVMFHLCISPIGSLMLGGSITFVLCICHLTSPNKNTNIEMSLKCMIGFYLVCVCFCASYLFLTLANFIIP